MLDRLDWDTYWRWELFRRASDPLDFRQWKRDSSRELREVFRDRPDALLLDSTCGLGDHTVNLREVGWRVEACDDSECALEATARVVREAGLDVPIFRTRWETLGASRPGRYDVIFNDALHWVFDRDEMTRVLRGLHDALRPGGALVFFFADERHPEPGAGLHVLEWDRTHLERASLAWDLQVGSTRATLTVVNEFGSDFVDQHHLYVSREGEGPAQLESLTMRRVYRWDWHAISLALRDAGFEGAHSKHFKNVKGHTFAMNFAYRELAAG